MSLDGFWEETKKGVFVGMPVGIVLRLFLAKNRFGNASLIIEKYIPYFNNIAMSLAW